MLQPVDYDDRQHTVYARGRALPPEGIAAWMGAFATHAPAQRPLTVLDLGSGTGRFTPALADTFGGPVWGVEPSANMRAEALRVAAHPAVTYLDGRAERIPLPDDSCDLVLMYLSFHHVKDRPAATAEIARVLKPLGRVLLRSTFADRLGYHAWHDFFPAARDIELRMFPTVAEVTDLFADVGLHPQALELVETRLSPSLAAYAERLRLRAISVFEHMTEADIARGFEALDAAVAAETLPKPVMGREDLLVLG